MLFDIKHHFWYSMISKVTMIHPHQSLEFLMFFWQNYVNFDIVIETIFSKEPKQKYLRK